MLLAGSLAGAWAQTTTTEQSQDSASIAVEVVQVQGNTLLPDTEVSKLVGHLTGGKRTLAELNRAAAMVQQAYRKAGYGGVVAFVPEQEMSNGKVIVRVVEGKIARVRISENKRLDDSNIRHSVPGLKEGTTPRVNAIDRDVQLANENPVKTLKVKLSPGANPGEIDAGIEVTEEKPLRILAGLDNTGTRETGEYRLSVGLQHANLWNRDHIGTLQYQTSPSKPDLVHIYSAGYRFPIYGYSSTIDAFYAHSSVDNGKTVTPAGLLEFAGTGDVAGLRFNYYLPRLGEYDHRITLGAEWRDFDNECSIGALGSAGCGSAAVGVAALPLSIAYSGQVEGPSMTWGASASFSHNAGGSSQEVFEKARPKAAKDYSVFRLSAYAARAVSAEFSLQARLAGQYSSDALIAGEQYGLGGASSVRGYDEREIAGDYGYVANIELLGPDLAKKLNSTHVSARPFVFFDYGHVANHEDTACHQTASSCSLSSAGIGARVAVGKWLTGRIDIGHTLEDGRDTASGSTRGHVSLNLVF